MRRLGIAFVLAGVIGCGGGKETGTGAVSDSPPAKAGKMTRPPAPLPPPPGQVR